VQEDDVDDDVKGEEDDDVENDDVEEEDRSQDRGPHCARACAVERHLEISQKPLFTEIYRKHSRAQSEPRTQKHARAQSERRVSPEQNTTVQDNDPRLGCIECFGNARQWKTRQGETTPTKHSTQIPEIPALDASNASGVQYRNRQDCAVEMHLKIFLRATLYGNL